MNNVTEEHAIAGQAGATVAPRMFKPQSASSMTRELVGAVPSHRPGYLAMALREPGRYPI
jgi:hypothetical protein